mgnify:CR=1 FL=1
MAFKTEMVENKIAVNYHGVVVYHTHKDNNIDNPVNDFIFSLDPYGNEYSVGEGDGEVFDIRNLAGYDDTCTLEANLLRAIDNGLLGETNITHSIEDGVNEYTCPVCGANLLADNGEVWEDGFLSDDGNGYIYRLHCPKCTADISQVYNFDFCGFVVE